MASSITLPDARTLAYALDPAPTDAPIVLLANPLTAPFTIWDHVVPVLNAGGFRTLRYDQPGHGDSSAPSRLESTIFDSMADDVRHLLRELNIERLHAWVGVSMGASTGVYFVTKYPGVVDRIAICDTISASPVNAGVDDLFTQRVAAARAAASLEPTVESTLDRWFGAGWLASNQQEAERIKNLMLRTSLDGFETCCCALRSEMYDLRPRFARVGAGVERALCVVGENDANLPQTMGTMRAEIEKGFAAAGKPEREVRLEVIKGAGHVSFVDGFEQFCDVVGTFLKE